MKLITNIVKKDFYNIFGWILTNKASDGQPIVINDSHKARTNQVRPYKRVMKNTSNMAKTN